GVDAALVRHQLLGLGTAGGDQPGGGEGDDDEQRSGEHHREDHPIGTEIRHVSAPSPARPYPNSASEGPLASTSAPQRTARNRARVPIVCGPPPPASRPATSPALVPPRKPPAGA